MPLLAHEADWLACVIDELERSNGPLSPADRDRVEQDMYGDYDIHDGPCGDDFDAWVADLEANHPEAWDSVPGSDDQAF